MSPTVIGLIRSKEQQTVVVTANNMRVEACLEEEVFVCVFMQVCRVAVHMLLINIITNINYQSFYS